MQTLEILVSETSLSGDFGCSLASQVFEAFVGVDIGLVTSPEKITCYFYDIVVQSTIDDVEVFIRTVAVNVSYSVYVSDRVDAINKRTNELIDGGVEFPPASGNVFSLSLEAQSNWNTLYSTFTSTVPLFTEENFPYKVSTKDNKSYFLQDGAELITFCGTAIATVSYHLETGRVLRDAVQAVDRNDADWQAQIDAIIDAR